MWTKLMCKLWAIRYEKAYREKVVKNILIFLAALVILCEAYCICTSGGLSVFGILAIIIFGTLIGYAILTKGGRNDAQDD